MKETEEKRNQLNLELRNVLAIIDMIDGVSNNYENYVENTLNEDQFLDQQIKLIREVKNRLLNIFK